MTSQTILLIEDNPDDQLLTLRAMKKNNISNEVVVATDGAEAIEYLFSAEAADRELPGLILLDLKLPKIDGLDVLHKIRADKRTQIIPVVVLTSSKEQEDILDSYHSGANGYVRKPVDFTDFSEAVRTLGMFWLLLNEPAPRIRPSAG
jgi:two-component system, response regulator